MTSPASPGSPLTYVPQPQMEPLMQTSLADTYALSGRRHSGHDHSLAGWPAQPKLVPTVITCKSPSSEDIRPFCTCPPITGWIGQIRGGKI